MGLCEKALFTGGSEAEGEAYDRAFPPSGGSSERGFDQDTEDRASYRRDNALALKGCRREGPLYKRPFGEGCGLLRDACKEDGDGRECTERDLFHGTPP